MNDRHASSTPRYSVVLPVFNEGANIGEFCRRAVAELPPGYELLVCYDFDEDDTLPALNELPASEKPHDVRLVKNDLGPGVRFAIEAGMRAARAPVVLVMMADLADDFSCVEPMVSRVEDGCDVVASSRYMRGGRQIGGPWLKGLCSRLAGVSLRWIAGLPTHDATNSFKAYRRAFLARTRIESRAGFSLALELTVKAHFTGGRVAEVPGIWRDRSGGESRFRLVAWLPQYLHWYFWAFNQSRRVRYLGAVAVVGLALTLAVSHLWLRPDLNWTVRYVLGEEGNQLYRAARLAQGRHLYSEIALQYGPLAVHLYSAFSTVVGNTITAVLAFHIVSSVLAIVLAYVFVRRHVDVVTALQVTLFGFLPLMLTPGGILGTYGNVEYMSWERVCLIAVLLAWRPPHDRRVGHAVWVGVGLGVWQWVKFGGAFFAGAALIVADLCYVLADRSRFGRTVTRNLATLGAFLAVQALLVAHVWATVPPHIAAEALWPAYVETSYSWTHPGWEGWTHFLGQQLLPLSCALLGVTAVGMLLKTRTGTRVTSTHSSDDALLLGPLYYAVAATGYFGHVHLYYQAAWALVPGAAWVLRRSHVAVRLVVMLVWLPSTLLLLKIIFWNPSAGQPLELPGGERIWATREAVAQIESMARQVAAIDPSLDPPHFATTFLNWGGGGFHHYYNPNMDLRNHMLASPVFRSYDADEFFAKLDRIDVIIIPRGTPGEELTRVFGPERTAQLLDEREVVPLAGDGVVLRKAEAR